MTFSTRVVVGNKDGVDIYYDGVVHYIKTKSGNLALNKEDIEPYLNPPPKINLPFLRDKEEELELKKLETVVTY